MTSLIGLLFFVGLLSTTGLELDCLRLDLGPNILFCRLGAIASFCKLLKMFGRTGTIVSFCDLLGMLSAGSLLKSFLFFLQQHIRNPVKFIWTLIQRKLPIMRDSAGGSYVLQLIRGRQIGPNLHTKKKRRMLASESYSSLLRKTNIQENVGIRTLLRL